VAGTCEKIGFIEFGTAHFQWFILWITRRNSIFSHVPGIFFPPGEKAGAEKHGAEPWSSPERLATRYFPESHNMMVSYLPAKTQVAPPALHAGDRVRKHLPEARRTWRIGK